MMGEDLQSASGEIVSLTTHVVECQGSRLRILIDGRTLALPASAIDSPDQTLTMQWTADGKRHWLRGDVVSGTGQLEVLGNPIYVNFPGRY
jgi:hypothetical protein